MSSSHCYRRNQSGLLVGSQFRHTQNKLFFFAEETDQRCRRGQVPSFFFLHPSLSHSRARVTLYFTEEKIGSRPLFLAQRSFCHAPWRTHIEKSDTTARKLSDRSQQEQQGIARAINPSDRWPKKKYIYEATQMNCSRKTVVVLNSAVASTRQRGSPSFHLKRFSE